jgi:hypothetical protein
VSAVGGGLVQADGSDEVCGLGFRSVRESKQSRQDAVNRIVQDMFAASVPEGTGSVSLGGQLIRCSGEGGPDA